MSTSWGSDCQSLDRRYTVSFCKRFKTRRDDGSRCWPLNTALALAFMPTLTGAMAGEPDTQRRAEILHLLKHDCGSCHGMTLKGGLGPSLRPADIGDISDEALVDTILNGRPGTPMAPWRISLDKNEADWLVGRLKDGIDGSE